MKPVPRSSSFGLVTWCVLAGACLPAGACHSSRDRIPPAIEFTRLAPAGEGTPDVFHTIEGRVIGARPGQRIVLFSRSGVWWVQPLAERPFTAIQHNSTWTSSIHPGTAYAALLVDASYRPPMTLKMLPPPGGLVQAVAIADEPALDRAPLKTLNFSGYDWLVRQTPGNPAGTRNLYDPQNVWLDRTGQLHLRIAKTPTAWASAEVRPRPQPRLRLVSFRRQRRLPSGSVDGADHLHVGWLGPDREMDIEISRWGELSGKNSQYVVQPYYVPANVVRFLSPPGRIDLFVRLAARTRRLPNGAGLGRGKVRFGFRSHLRVRCSLGRR